MPRGAARQRPSRSAELQRLLAQAGYAASVGDLHDDSDTTEADDPLLGERLGGFEISALIGRGAFATVYRARQIRLGREVAVKVLDPLVARDPGAARRFEEEAKRAAGLDHPSIVPVYDAGEQQGRFYLAMRFINGWSLADELRETPRLAPARLLEITAALTSALDHAHEHGIVHRDVKPDNVLLEPSRVWLADFGIAATVETVGQYTTGTLGTAQYMAPEQAQPGPIDGRADLYGLGCVIYECWTGSPPFEGASLAAVLLAHAQDPAPSTGSESMDAFMRRALAKAPEDRYATGGELLEALRSAIGSSGAENDGGKAARARLSTGQPGPVATVTGEPPTRPRPSRPRRRTLSVLVVAVVGAAAVVALAVVLLRHPRSVASSHALSEERLCTQDLCVTVLPGFTKNPAYSNQDILALNQKGHPGELVKYGILTQLTPPHLSASQVVAQVLTPDRLRLEGATSSQCSTAVTPMDGDTLASGYVCYKDPSGDGPLQGTYYEARTTSVPATALALSVTDAFEVLPGDAEEPAVAKMFASMALRRATVNR